MGAMDSTYCVLISLALWLEMNFRSNPNALLSPYLFSLSDDVSVPGGGKKSKEIASNVFTRIFKMEEFGGGGGTHTDDLGSHSVRKYGSTHCRRCGCSRDDKDLRGRWKSKSRVSDVYDDTELPFPDAKVCQCLCIGGPCYYLLQEEVNSTNIGDVATAVGPRLSMMNTFILSSVVPNIKKECRMRYHSCWEKLCSG
jgi:hypothetical protein